MPTEEDIQHQYELLKTHRQSLSRLLLQAAQYGGENFSPLNVSNTIDAVRHDIEYIKHILRNWGEAVEDLPYEIKPIYHSVAQEVQPDGGFKTVRGKTTRLRFMSKRMYLFILFAMGFALSLGIIVIAPQVRSFFGLSTPGSIIFTEQFSQNLTDTWQQKSGHWSIYQGALTGIGNSPNNLAVIWLNRDLKNKYSVSFKTRILEGYFSELMLHVSTGKYIGIYIRPDADQIVLRDGRFPYNPGKGATQIPWGGDTIRYKEFPIELNTWYEIKVINTDNLYTIMIEGQEVLRYTDADKILSSEGPIGFISNGWMEFDDVVIRES